MAVVPVPSMTHEFADDPSVPHLTIAFERRKMGTSPLGTISPVKSDGVKTVSGHRIYVRFLERLFRLSSAIKMSVKLLMHWDDTPFTHERHTQMAQEYVAAAERDFMVKIGINLWRFSRE